MSIEQLQSNNKEWSNSLFFLEDKTVLKSTIGEIDPTQIEAYITAFNDYDETIKLGVTFNGVHYHVHRFYDGIMYGRADPNTKRNDGFCLYRTEREDKPILYVFITYDLPNVSAKIVPEMVKQVEAIKQTI